MLLCFFVCCPIIVFFSLHFRISLVVGVFGIFNERDRRKKGDGNENRLKEDGACEIGLECVHASNFSITDNFIIDRMIDYVQQHNASISAVLCLHFNVYLLNHSFSMNVMVTKSLRMWDTGEKARYQCACVCVCVLFGRNDLPAAKLLASKVQSVQLNNAWQKVFNLPFSVATLK